MLGSTVATVTDSLDFWRGVGKLVVICLLIIVMYLVVMAYSGNRVRFRWPWTRSQHSDAARRDAAHDESSQAAADEISGGSTGVGGDPSAPASPTDRSAHLDLLATLRTSLRYQGATVALIVIAVLILGIDHVLGGSEVATILSGIAGYVLGSGRTQQPTTTTPRSRAGRTQGADLLTTSAGGARLKGYRGRAPGALQRASFQSRRGSHACHPHGACRTSSNHYRSPT
jgi:hypothetical protein